MDQRRPVLLTGTPWSGTMITGLDYLMETSIDRVAKSPFAAFCSSESEKRGFRFPYKSMTYSAGH